MLKAIIFDFDGIIVDTEPIHYRAFQKVLVPLAMGYSWDTYLERYIGFDDRDAFREAFKEAGTSLDETMLEKLIDRKAEEFEEIVKGGVEPYPGVLDLIRHLSGKIPLALCSGALRRDITPILGMLGVGDEFDVMVTADDVHASKPDPASYRLAVKRLSEMFGGTTISPEECLAIEDTPAGIASASAAGIPVLAVTNSYDSGKLGGATRIVDSLEKLDLAAIRGLVP